MISLYKYIYNSKSDNKVDGHIHLFNAHQSLLDLYNPLSNCVGFADIEFDSIISAVQSGKADVGVAGMTVTEDRLKNIDFTDPYTTATQVIIVRK